MGDGAKSVKIFVEYYVEYSDESGPLLAKRMREYRMKKGSRMTATPLHAVDLIWNQLAFGDRRIGTISPFQRITLAVLATDRAVVRASG